MPGASQHPQVAQVTQGFENLALTTASHGQSQYYNLPQPPVPAIAPQYPQVGQVTQSMKNLGIMTTSYGPVQYSHPPQPQLSTFGRATQIAAGQLSAEDEEKLRTAVATGASYPDIKDIMFSDRFDLTAQILQEHAHRIGAEWLPEEDSALLTELVDEQSRNPSEAYLARLQARLQEQGVISALRTTEDIKARIKYQIELREHLNTRYPPTQRSSQGQRGPAYCTQGDIPASAAANPSYQAPGSSSYQAETFSQRRAGPSAWSTQDYGVPPTAPQPFPGGTRQIWNHKAKTTPQFSEAEIKDIKIKMAQGLTYDQIGALSEHQRTGTSIYNAMYRRKYQRWSTEQDEKLLELQKAHGENWVEIGRNLPGPARCEEETQARWKKLTEAGKGEHDLKTRHKYSSEEDHYIRLQVARGTLFAKIAENRFPNISGSNLWKHAQRINAMWIEEDDQKLMDKVREYEDAGLEVDWGSIGQQFQPARDDGVVVETRWQWLLGLLPPEA